MLPTSSLVPGCAGCALTTTGLPPASADAVSPPATEKARGKLLAPNTATGPSGRSMERTSGRGGMRVGSAVSMRASTHEPSSTIAANSRSCPLVRPTSPVSLGRGKAVSRFARTINDSAAASSPSAICRSRRPRSAPVLPAIQSAAALAAATARSTSSGPAERYAGSSAAPSKGLKP
jgi:hypothetical protein